MKRIIYSISLLFPLLFLLQLGKKDNPVLISSVNSGLSVGSDDKLIYPELVNKFYSMNGGKNVWFSSSKESVVLRQQLRNIIDTSFYYGIIAKKYHSQDFNDLQGNLLSDSSSIILADRLYTDAAIAVFKDLYQGYTIKPWVGHDPISTRYADKDNDYLLRSLLSAFTASQLKSVVNLLEPVDSIYLNLKQELIRQKAKNKQDTISFLITSMTYYRWIRHFHFDKFIVVNLPAARLYYFEKDRLKLQMKTIVGKPSTPSPRFAAYCDQAILYPYWYVPRSIIFNEFLPRIKKNPSWLDGQNMQVVDGTGKVLNHLSMNWEAIHSGNFPYMIRQSTGCDNALGVIKFNINTPYGVYLHDTNNKTAFLSGYRFYSHGCIRIEEPIKLASYLLPGKIDKKFLESCFKDQKPVPVSLKEPLPVFVVYMPADALGDKKVRYYKDVYKLMR